MAGSKNTERIYVELDTLLDTRIGTIARMHQDAAVTTLKNNYVNRDTDIFDAVNMEEYTRLYGLRDVETLAYSTVTGMVLLVQHLVTVLTEQASVRPYHDEIKVVVNIYPYKLEEDEITELGKVIAVWMKGVAPVEIVNISREKLTPSHCKQRYAMMILYEYESWFNMHADAFKKNRLPEIVMFVPAIYFKKKPNPEELTAQIKRAMHPMQAIELLASPIVELRLIDTQYFSAIKLPA